MALVTRPLVLTPAEAINPTLIETKLRSIVGADSLEDYDYETRHVPRPITTSSYDSSEQRIKALSQGIPKDVQTLYIFEALDAIITIVPGLQNLLDNIVIIPELNITLADYLESANSVKAKIKAYAESVPNWKDAFADLGIPIPDLGDIEQEVQLAMDKLANLKDAILIDQTIAQFVSTSAGTMANYFTSPPYTYAVGAFAAVVNEYYGLSFPSEQEVRDAVSKIFTFPSIDQVVPEIPEVSDLQNAIIDASGDAKDFAIEAYDTAKNTLANFIPGTNFPDSITIGIVGVLTYSYNFGDSPLEQPYELERAIVDLHGIGINDLAAWTVGQIETVLNVIGELGIPVFPTPNIGIDLYIQEALINDPIAEPIELELV